MSEADPARELREQGVALLRGAFETQLLARLKLAAERCFEAVESEGAIAERCGFNRFSHSVPITALRDFGCHKADLLAPTATPGVASIISVIMNCEWECRMDQSWVRKKFAPNQSPAREYHLQGWHQDGALGVSFPVEPEHVPPMNELLTCWIPLDPCGVDSPGLEFVRGRRQGLLHFTELADSGLQQRFPSDQFWAPELVFGDGLIFLNSVLHRTFVRPGMRENRISVEYRIFP